MRGFGKRKEAPGARSLILGLGSDLLTLRETEDVLRRAGAVLAEALLPRRVAFFLRERTHGQTHLAWQHPSGGDVGVMLHGPVAEGLAAFEEGGHWWDIAVGSASASVPDEEAPFELLVALRAGMGLLGCIALSGRTTGRPYTREDRELVAALATQMGLALENATLLEVARREAEHGRELEIARRVQQGLFPAVLPQRAGWDFAALCRPAKVVGGDYYDLFEPDPGHVVVALGDVSGKGMGPSLIMSAVQALIRSHFRRSAGELPSLVDDLSRHVLDSCSPETFVTLFVGVIDTGVGGIRYVNAGHNPPLLVPDEGEESSLAEGGVPVGMLEGASYAEGSALIEPGSILVIHSDGVTEARDRKREFYGEDRLSREILDLRRRGASDVLTGIVSSVDRFTGGAEQADDLSLVVVRREQ